MASERKPLPDVENGGAEPAFGEKNAIQNDNEDAGEYGNLVRYISNYKDGRGSRKASTVAGDDEHVKKPWWKFGGKSGGANGEFETPDEWLETDMRKGLTDAEVISRRRKTGWNELSSEETNMFLTFIGYFKGPVLYGKFFFPRDPCELGALELTPVFR